MSEHDTNGNRAENDPLIDQLVLTFNRRTGELGIGGKVLNEDMAMAILAQATRHFETVLRLQAVAKVKMQEVEQARTNALLQSVRGGRV